MKSVLPEWYVPNDDEMEDFVTSGTVALDANVLLDLYRMSEDQRNTVLDVLRQVQDRLWVPYQFALEYQRNRLKVVSDLDKGYQALATGITKLQDTALKDVKDPALRSQLAGELERAQKKMSKRIERIWAEHFVSVGEARQEDPIRLLLDDLLGPGRVGEKPAEDLLKERRTEADKRYEKKVPPGYSDVKEKEDPSGDYLAWCELLDYAGQSGKPLLLVTNDTKEDWYQTHAGEKLGPRPELVREMLNGNARYHHTTLDGFLRQAKRFIAAVVDEDTIEAVEALSTEDVSRRPAPGSLLAEALRAESTRGHLAEYFAGQGNSGRTTAEALGINVNRDIGVGISDAWWRDSKIAELAAKISADAMSERFRESVVRAILANSSGPEPRAVKGDDAGGADEDQ